MKNLDTIPVEITHNGSTHVQRLIRPNENHPGDIATINYAWLEPQKQLTVHSHPDGEEFYFFIDGAGDMLANGSWVNVKKGTFITVPIGSDHSVKNTGLPPLCFVTIRTLHKSLKNPL